MPTRKIVTPPAAINFDAIRDELGIPSEYPAHAVAEAIAVATRPPRVPEVSEFPFVTIDPAESMDLDQAVHLSRDNSGGYVVRYAIADVASFVDPDGPLAEESWRRGSTLYSPDRNTPLHPVQLSEGAASLLPGDQRSAVLWTIRLDDRGEPVEVDVRRTAITSAAKLDYESVQ